MSEKLQDPTIQEPQDLPLIHDSIVRLERAASESAVPLEKLIEAASSGELELLFQRPAVHPYVVLRPRGPDLVTGKPNMLCTPDYLKLSQDDCKQLLDRPSALVYYSTLGYRSRGNHTGLTRLEPGEADKRPLFPVQVDGEDFSTPAGMFGFWGSWSLWSDAGPIQHAVRPEDVFVRTGEMKRWRIEHYYPEMGWDAGTSPNPEYSLLDDPNFDDDHKSPQLLWMCEAAVHFWANKNIVFDNPKSHPKNEAVATWLLDKAGDVFSATSAADAARLIRPRFAPLDAPLPSAPAGLKAGKSRLAKI